MPKQADPAIVFGRVLRTLRTDRELSQARLAELSGLDRTYVSLLERGLRQPSLRTMLDLGVALGVSLVTLASAVEADL